MKKGWIKTVPPKAKAVKKGYDDLCCGPMQDHGPQLYLNDRELPDIKDWKFGEELTITIKAKVTNLSSSQYNDDEPRTNATLEIKEMNLG